MGSTSTWKQQLWDTINKIISDHQLTPPPLYLRSPYSKKNPWLFDMPLIFRATNRDNLEFPTYESRIYELYTVARHAGCRGNVSSWHRSRLRRCPKTEIYPRTYDWFCLWSLIASPMNAVQRDRMNIEQIQVDQTYDPPVPRGALQWTCITQTVVRTTIVAYVLFRPTLCSA